MDTLYSESSLPADDSFDIRKTIIYQDYLKKSEDEVRYAAMKANVSPNGFQIDETYCDFGEVDTSGVVDLVDEAARHFGAYGDFNYLYIVRALTESITQVFSAKA